MVSRSQKSFSSTVDFEARLTYFPSFLTYSFIYVIYTSYLRLHISVTTEEPKLNAGLKKDLSVDTG